MKSVALRLATLVCSLSLFGCSSLSLDSIGLESKKIDYKTASASKVPSLEIPPDLTSPTRDDRFAVPDNGGKGTATYSAYAGERSGTGPKQSEVLPSVEKAHIERSGNQRWLVVSGTPDKLWESVKDFWQETGFLIKIEKPEAGVMETDWAEDRAKISDGLIRGLLGKVLDSMYSTSERDKFRTRFEPGAQPGTTEIYISHRGMYETYVTEGRDETRWEPRPVDPDLEAEMLRRLMVRLGSDQKHADAEIALAKTKPVDRAKMTRSNDGAGTLEVQESFDRAWRRVGLALDRVGFTVEDRDRSKGLYFVRYVDPEADGQKKEDGILSKLAFWKGAGPAPQAKYRILVQSGDALTRVQVLSAEGGTDNSETAKKILTLLFDQLK